MTPCPSSEQLSAFLDDEVSDSRRAEMQEHLRVCPMCAAELERMKSVSRVVSESPAPHLSQISLHRLHVRVDEAMDQGLLRFVRVFNVVAACVLIAGSSWLMVKTHEARTVESTTPAAPPWVDVAEVSDTPTGAYSTPAAAWYLADDRGDETP